MIGFPFPVVPYITAQERCSGVVAPVDPGAAGIKRQLDDQPPVTCISARTAVSPLGAWSPKEAMHAE
jgi:hypothetical protein